MRTLLVAVTVMVMSATSAAQAQRWTEDSLAGRTALVVNQQTSAIGVAKEDADGRIWVCVVFPTTDGYLRSTAAERNDAALGLRNRLLNGDSRGCELLADAVGWKAM